MWLKFRLPASSKDFCHFRSFSTVRWTTCGTLSSLASGSVGWHTDSASTVMSTCLCRCPFKYLTPRWLSLKDPWLLPWRSVRGSSYASVCCGCVSWGNEVIFLLGLITPFRIQFRLLGNTLKTPNPREYIAFTLSDKTTYQIKLCGVFTLCISVLKM